MASSSAAANAVQVIDILSSSDDEEMPDQDNSGPVQLITNKSTTNCSIDSKPSVDSAKSDTISLANNSTIPNNGGLLGSQCNKDSPSKILTPEECAESRRRKIDCLLDNYERGQHRLRTVEPLMDPAQKLRWHRLSNSNQSNDTPINLQHSYGQAPGSSSAQFSRNSSGPQRTFQRPPWFIDPPCSVTRTVTVRRTTTTRTTARPQKRRYKKKRKATPRASTSRTTTKTATRTPTRTKASTSKANTSKASTSRASTSTASSSRTCKVEVKPKVTVRIKKE